MMINERAILIRHTSDSSDGHQHLQQFNQTVDAGNVDDRHALDSTDTCMTCEKVLGTGHCLSWAFTSFCWMWLTS